MRQVPRVWACIGWHVVHWLWSLGNPRQRALWLVARAAWSKDRSGRSGQSRPQVHELFALSALAWPLRGGSWELRSQGQPAGVPWVWGDPRTAGHEKCSQMPSISSHSSLRSVTCSFEGTFWGEAELQHFSMLQGWWKRHSFEAVGPVFP